MPHAAGALALQHRRLAGHRRQHVASRESETGGARSDRRLYSRRANSPRLNLFERSVKCGVEFCFFLVRRCLGDASEIGGNDLENKLHLIIR